MPRLASFALCAAALSLAACATNDDRYPSLARRPAERTDAAPPTPTPEPTLPSLDGAVMSRAASMATEGRAAHARFAAQQSAAEARVGAARGAAEGSETWSLASIALARLIATRGETMAALAGLDRLDADGRLAGADVSPLAPLLAEVGGLIEREDAAIAALERQLAR